MQIRIGLLLLLACGACRPVEMKVVESQPDVKLEHAFWVCDYVGTTRGAHYTDAEACSSVTEAMKNTRFGGDYDVMVEWWRQNRAAAHLEVSGALNRELLAR